MATLKNKHITRIRYVLNLSIQKRVKYNPKKEGLSANVRHRRSKGHSNTRECRGQQTPFFIHFRRTVLNIYTVNVGRGHKERGV